MDFNLKQWRNQDESEEQHSTKMPKLLPESHHHHHHHHHHQQQQSAADASALPLFAPEPNSTSKVSTLSDSTLAPANTNTTRFPRMGSYFSLAQWQELELQALIFRYMLAGAAVPPELLQPIKKSLIHSTPYFLHHPLQHYQPAAAAALLQSGYWGRAAMDPEPGRCRRTDGKKWRCSRDVVAGQKYCERHMHRGRNRSRKPVELPTPSSAGATNLVASSSSSISSPPLASASLKSPFDLLHLNDRSTSSGTKEENKSVFENQDHHHHHVGGNGRSGGHMLRHFFDDWPRSLQEPDNADSNGGGGRMNMNMNSATSLSISMAGNTSSSDVSLKLSTGYGEDPGPRNGNVEAEQEHLQLNWAAGWASASQVASMGGPLAEALRSSTSTSSPTSVLHQLPRASASETSFIST